MKSEAWRNIQCSLVLRYNARHHEPDRQNIVPLSFSQYFCTSDSVGNTVINLSVCCSYGGKAVHKTIHVVNTENYLLISRKSKLSRHLIICTCVMMKQKHLFSKPWSTPPSPPPLPAVSFNIAYHAKPPGYWWERRMISKVFFYTIQKLYIFSSTTKALGIEIGSEIRSAMNESWINDDTTLMT